MASNSEPIAQTVQLRNHKNWIDGYVEYTDNTEAPRAFHLWTAVSTIAGALGRKCFIKIGRFELQPSFYITFVAPPGIATKSTTARLGMDLLEECKAIRMFRGSASWQAFLDEMKDGETQTDMGNGKLWTMSCLQVFASELGVLLNSDHDGSMIDLLVDIWDGGPSFKRRTRSGGEMEISRPFLNMIACTTPSWLTNNGGKYAVDGGFFSRTIFVYADKKSKLVAYPNAGVHADDRRKALLQDLNSIKLLRGEFVMDDDALAFGEAWYTEFQTSPPPHLSGEMFQSYLSRRQAHLHKVAMVVSAARSSEMIITIDDMAEAEALLLESELELKAIYQAIVTSDKIQAYNLIIKNMRGQTKGVPKNVLFRMMSTSVTMNEFEAGLQAAIFARHVKLVQLKGEYYVMPADIL